MTEVSNGKSIIVVEQTPVHTMIPALQSDRPCQENSQSHRKIQSSSVQGQAEWGVLVAYVALLSP